MGLHGVVFSLHSLTVGILPAVKAALRRLQLTQQITGRAICYIRIRGILCLFACLTVGKHQQRIVIEHLFKVRDKPLAVGGIARKTAADLIEDTAARHGGQRGFHHIPFSVCHKKQQIMRRRKFRCRTKTAPFCIKTAAQGAIGAVQKSFVGMGGFFACLPQKIRDPFACLQQALPVIFPQPDHLLQQLQQSRLTVAAVLGKICAGKERFLLRCEQYGHRPAAGACHRLADSHIHCVNVGPLLPVHLDAYKMFVELCRHLLIFKGFVGHYMTPMASGVAYAEKNGFVLAFGPRKRLVAPRIPIHRIVLVLQQVR